MREEKEPDARKKGGQQKGKDDRWLKDSKKEIKNMDSPKKKRKKINKERREERRQTPERRKYKKGII